MVSTRENRTLAVEVKFVLDAGLGARIRDWSRTHLQADPHGAGPFGDEYHTSSLYFDTPDLDVFQRHGSFGRAKYRIRRYSNADFAFLERKLRKPGIVAKRRTRVPLSVLDRLETADPGADWPGAWFHARLAVRGLKPVCCVSYQRMARTVSPTSISDGLSRLTLDDALSAAPAGDIRFDEPRSGEDILAGQLILELKYRVSPPAIFRRLVEEFALTTATASKYRLGMRALGHVPLDMESRPAQVCPTSEPRARRSR